MWASELYNNKKCVAVQLTFFFVLRVRTKRDRGVFGWQKAFVCVCANVETSTSLRKGTWDSWLVMMRICGMAQLLRRQILDERGRGWIVYQLLDMIK